MRSSWSGPPSSDRRHSAVRLHRVPHGVGQRLRAAVRLHPTSQRPDARRQHDVQLRISGRGRYFLRFGGRNRDCLVFHDVFLAQPEMFFHVKVM
jgi:hypothetical protein